MSHWPNDSPPAPRRSGSDLQHDRLLREALVGAGTTVWSWDLDRDVLGGIDGGVALLGYAPGERERTLSSWHALIHPDDLAANADAFRRHAKGETAQCEREYRALARDGGWRWLAERGRIVEWQPDGRARRMVGTLTDVTRRRTAEHLAHDIDERLREIARHVPGVLYQFRRLGDGSGSGDNSFPYVSERSAEVLGSTQAELMHDAATLFDRIHGEDRPAVHATSLESAQGLTPWRAEFRLQVPGRGWRWLLAASTPQRAADGAVLWCGYMHDVTELRELQHAREHVAAAEAANRAKSEFLSRMSHELRTPLNAVLGFAQLMEMDGSAPLGDAQRKRVAIIRDSGEHLLRMIGDLLDHARIEAAQMSVAIDDVALEPLLQRCAVMLAPQAGAARVTVTVEPTADAARVRADVTRLRQVLLNLLGNAIKYNRPGGTVRLHAERAGPDWAIHVADSGVGIAVDLQPRLFAPFDRLAHTHSGIEGAGMGLAISRSLVTLMNGRIEVASDADAGSTFSVFLPAADAPPPQDQASNQG